MEPVEVYKSNLGTEWIVQTPIEDIAKSKNYSKIKKNY